MNTIVNNYNNNSNNNNNDLNSMSSVDGGGGHPLDTKSVRFADQEEKQDIYDSNGLRVQRLETLDVKTLNALTPEVISRQATINIGMIGHVSHGKSTLVQKISQKKTQAFRDELVRNITIKLGYANAKLYKCTWPEDPEEEARQNMGLEGKDRIGGLYASQKSNHPDEYDSDEEVKDKLTGLTKKTIKKRWVLQRHVSFVDCPGHDVYMATMLNGAAIMDAAILLVAANEACPMPQTAEHVASIEIMKLDNIIVCQNKIDLVRKDIAEQHHAKIQEFLKGSKVSNKPIIPISAVLGVNVDTVIEFICRNVPVPVRNFEAVPRMIVIRSFDVNLPGEDVKKLKGGVAGGSIFEGVFRIGDEIEIRPGKCVADRNGNTVCQIFYTKIVSLFADDNLLQYAVPGGLIGVGTMLDPSLTRADKLVGQVLGIKGKLPEVYKVITAEIHLLDKLLGVRAVNGVEATVENLKLLETLQLNIGSNTVPGTVKKIEESGKDKTFKVTLKLERPVCVGDKEKIAISRRMSSGHSWRLIGWGDIKEGKKAKIDTKFDPDRSK